MPQSPPSPGSEHLNPARILFLALAAAVATSTSYTVQPELGLIAQDLDASIAATSAAAGLPILGYMIGLALLVPLVDRAPANTLVCAQLAALAGALGITAAAASVELFGAGLFMSGVCASTGAQMSTLAAKHSPPGRRGRALGIVTAGISAGILFGRAVGGGLTDAIGWRAMLICVAGVCLVCAVVSRGSLPRRVERAPRSWSADLLAMPHLLRVHPGLLVAALAGALWFFAFSLVWVAASLALSLPPHGLSPTTIGAYALAGVAGMAVTPFAGRMADRFGSRPVVIAGLVVAALCIGVIIPGLGAAPLVLIALALFDAGLFSAQVANQRQVLDLDPRRPAHLNSAYMVIYFIGGSIGAGAGGPLVTWLGWPIAAAVALAAILAALTLYGFGSERLAERTSEQPSYVPH